MSNQNVTTLELMEELADTNYRTQLVEYEDGMYVKVYEDSNFIGSVRVDEMYCLEVNASVEKNYRKCLLDTLYKYAATPVERRKEPLYRVGLSRTSLYINHINKNEATVTANKSAAKVYRMAEVEEIQKIAKQNKIELFIEDTNRVAN